MIFNYVRVGRILREMREEKDWSLRFTAEGICHPGTLSKIENGLVPSPHKDHLLKLIQKLGEKEFYVRYENGMGLAQFKRKEFLKELLVRLINQETLDDVEELLMEFKTYITDEEGEDMQYYLGLQTMWYRMKGVNSIKDWTQRYIDIYEISKKFPEPESMEVEDFKKIKCNFIEKQLINSVGISKLLEGKPYEACQIFIGLFIIMTHDDDRDLPEEEKKLAKLCNNIAIAAAKSDSYHAAKKFMSYADDYTNNCNDINLVAITQKIKVEVAELGGRFEEADILRKSIEDCRRAFKIFGMDIDKINSQTQLAKGIAIL